MEAAPLMLQCRIKASHVENRSEVSGYWSMGGWDCPFIAETLAVGVEVWTGNFGAVRVAM